MILSLDVGTTAAKTVLFTAQGQEVLLREETYATRSLDGGGLEQDGALILRAVLSVLSAAALANTDRRSKELIREKIEAIVISSQGGSTLFCDQSGEPIAPVVTWLDQRAAKIVEGWSQNGTSQFFRKRSGWSPQPGLPASVLAWFGKHRREVLERSDRIASIHDWLVKLLTGNWITNPSCASEMLLVNRSTGTWDRELCEISGGVDPRVLSEIRSSFDQVGELLPDIAEETGLPAHLPVYNGGQDHSCEAYAIGMDTPGQGLLACGTAWVINVAVSDKDEGMVPTSMDLNYHIPEGKSVASTFLGGFGAGLEWWFREIWAGAEEITGDERKALFEQMELAVSAVPEGSRGLLFDPVGLGPGGLVGLTLAHGRGEMTRAYFEGVARRVAEGFKLLEGSGLEPRALWMVGGATRSRIWPKIIAQACGIPVRLFDYSHGPALGAAMIAAESMGWVTNHQEAMELFSVTGTLVDNL